MSLRIKYIDIKHSNGKNRPNSIQEPKQKKILFRRKHKKRNPNWPKILNYPNRISLIGGSGSEKINVLLNLVSNKLILIKHTYTQNICMNQIINY